MAQNETDHDDITRESFERQLGLFRDAHSPFARSAERFVEGLTPLGPDMIVLDVACGGAHVAEQAASRVRQVVGLDLTPALLALGSDRLRQAGVSNVLLQVGSATALPFVDNSFDLVIFRSALHHMVDQERPLTEIARVCRPGGRVAVADLVAPSAGARESFDRLHRALDPSHVGVLLQAELLEKVSSAVGDPAPRVSLQESRHPIENILTDASDRNVVLTSLRAELDGGPVTGFAPSSEDGQVWVSFLAALALCTKSTV